MSHWVVCWSVNYKDKKQYANLMLGNNKQHGQYLLLKIKMGQCCVCGWGYTYMCVCVGGCLFMVYNMHELLSQFGTKIISKEAN